MIRDLFLNLVFPPKCILCGKLLKKDETDLCRACRVESPLCDKNNLKFPFLDSWAAVWYYKGNIRKSLHRYKFRRARHYAPAYGRLLAMKILKEYPEADCTLDYAKPHELLFSVRLAAQCTDERVNMVTKELYQKYPTLEAIANADLLEFEQDIRSTGFYHNKAKNIIACARRLLEDFGGEVPRSLEELTRLPGVGRKTANVIRGNIYDDPSVVVDTHVKRISYRLGLTKNTDPEAVEYDLMKVLPKDHWILYNIQIITFGRQICFARNPKCVECPLKELCRSKDKVV